MSSSEPDVEAQLSSLPPTARTSFRTMVNTLILIRHWLLHTRQRMAESRQAQAEENVRRVFAMETVRSERNDEKCIRRLWGVSFEDTSSFFYFWTLLVFIGCSYNLIMIVVMVFEEVTRHFHGQWIVLNLCFDVVFLLDAFILTRREFIDGGVRVNTPKEMLLHRIKSKQFILDMLCLLPTDLLLLVRSDLSLSRLNRLLKCYRLSDFNALTEIRTSWPNFFRLAKLVFTCFVIFHWNGCVYFFISVLYNYNTALLDHWVFSWDKIPNPRIVTCDIHETASWDYCSSDVIEPLRNFAEAENLTEETEIAMAYWENRSRIVEFSNFTKQYGLSFYWSALTLVTLGEQPWPNDTFQNSFEIGDTLLGLVIFAVIVGDVGNMVSNMNLKKSDFEEVLDGCKSYLIYRNVPIVLRRKAVEYFSYMWNHEGGQVDEAEIAEFLPPRLCGQLAVHIHMETLRKVKLFEDCEPNLLYELILKLVPRVYSPKDYVCNKGEVGTEMYIVKRGFVEVVNEDGSKVFVTLGEGTVFGELSILNIPGNKNGNRRTANVRSVGYSDLYVLSKEALWEALREYPEATKSLLNKGKEILKKDNLFDESAVEVEEFDADSPIEAQLEMIQRAVNAFEELMDAEEKRIRDYSTRSKQRLFAVEKEMIEEIKWLKKKMQSEEEVQ